MNGYEFELSTGFMTDNLPQTLLECVNYKYLYFKWFIDYFFLFLQVTVDLGSSINMNFGSTHRHHCHHHHGVGRQ